jgi:hypothetical protein
MVPPRCRRRVFPWVASQSYLLRVGHHQGTGRLPPCKTEGAEAGAGAMLVEYRLAGLSAPKPKLQRAGYLGW